MISPEEVLVRLLLAAVLGGVIGFERERREWAAGLRTHMLVALGAALAIIVSAFGFFDVLANPGVILDPSRIAAQVISGIGFLGAGTILFLQREQVIRGLTTAAGLWAVASIGLAAGAGMFIAAGIGTAIVFIIMAALKPVEKRFFNRKSQPRRMELALADTAELTAVRAAVIERGVEVRKMVLRRDDADRDHLEIHFAPGADGDDMTPLIDALRKVPGVASISLGSSSGPS